MNEKGAQLELIDDSPRIFVIQRGTPIATANTSILVGKLL